MPLSSRVPLRYWMASGSEGTEVRRAFRRHHRFAVGDSLDESDVAVLRRDAAIEKLIPSGGLDRLHRAETLGVRVGEDDIHLVVGKALQESLHHAPPAIVCPLAFLGRENLD